MNAVDNKTLAGWGKYFRAYVNGAAALFLLAGLAMYFASSGTDRQLMLEDAVFGLKTQRLLLLAAVFHVALGVYLFVPGGLTQRGLLILWAGWCYLIYHLGMLWMDVTTPFPTVQLVGWKLGANNPQLADILWKLLIAFLVLGSLWHLVWEWRETQRVDLEAFWKRWTASRRQGTQPATPPNRGGTGASPEAQAAEFKFSCPACGQHIRCEQSYAGKEINCPACHQLFRVPEIIPARSGVSEKAGRH
jgi:hypothetical protein